MRCLFYFSPELFVYFFYFFLFFFLVVFFSSNFLLPQMTEKVHGLHGIQVVVAALRLAQHHLLDPGKKTQVLN